MKTAIFLSLALLVGGCYRTTIVSGLPESNGIPALRGSNHGGYVNGIVESDELRLDHLCKDGWSSIHVETGFINGVTNWLYGLIYHQENVTLKCAKGPPAAGAPSGSASPPASASPPPVAPASTAPVHSL
jgi:hypothetical protein